MNLPSAQPQIGMMLHMQPEPGESIPAFLCRRAQLVQALERTGVDAVWVTEHHFDPMSLSASPLLLLAHWAAHTQRIQLGVAAVLAAGRNPVLLAEDIALLSHLAPGRVAIGFAKGGPFEAQKRIFGWGSEQARTEMRDVVDALLDVLHAQPRVELGAAHGLLQPPLHGRVPMFIASREPDTLAWAARRGLGWMSAQFWPLDVYDAQAVNWGVAASSPADALLVRGLWIDDDSSLARSHALRWLADFRRHKQAQWKVGFRGPLDEDEAEILSRMIVGTPSDCAAQLADLLATRNVPRLAFNPMHAQPGVQLAQMQRLLNEVLPLLPSQTAACPARAQASRLA